MLTLSLILGPTQHLMSFPKIQPQHLFLALFFMCQFWWFNKSDFPTRFKMSTLLLCLAGTSLRYFCFSSWENETLWNPFSPELYSLRVEAGSHLQLWPPRALVPLKGLLLLPAASLRPQKLSHFCFYMGSDHFFFSPLWKTSHLSHSDMSIAGYISDYKLCEDGHIWSMSGALPCVPKAPSVPPKLPLPFLTTFVASWCC